MCRVKGRKEARQLKKRKKGQGKVIPEDGKSKYVLVFSKGNMFHKAKKNEVKEEKKLHI